MSDALKRAIDIRKRIGRRWHGLKGEALARFVEEDLDLRARICAEGDRSIAQIIATAKSIIADDVTLAELRQELGDREFEEMFATLVAVARRSSRE